MIVFQFSFYQHPFIIVGDDQLSLAAISQRATPSVCCEISPVAVEGVAIYDG